MDIFCWNIDGKNKEVEFSFLHDIIITNRFCGFLLNTDLEKYSLLEKYVFDIAMFHFNRLNITFNKNNHCIQFWWKNQFTDNNFHVDCDKYDLYINNKMTYPLLSCITYINDNNYPTAITNITQNQIDEKQIDNVPDDNYIYFSYPKKYKHVAFDGKKYHGMVNLSNSNIFEDNCRLILCMNLLDYVPLNIPYYNADLHTNYFLEYYKRDVSKILFNKDEKLFSLIANSSLSEIYVENVFTDDFYDNLLFNKFTNSKIVLSELYEIITSNNYCSLVVKSKKINTNVNDQTISISIPIFFTNTICNWVISSINDIYENNETIITFVNSIKLLILNNLKISNKQYSFEKIQIVNTYFGDESYYDNSLKFQIVLTGQHLGNLMLHNNNKMFFNTGDIFLNGIIKKCITK